MSIDDVLSGKKRWHVELGDSAEILRTLPAGCVGAVVTDPPAGIGFMGLEFDRNRGGRAQWVAWLAEVLRHARAATRDGGRALVWSLPRTSHWTGCAVEDAGWSIESTVTHLFGTGWPKGKSQLKPLAETWWLARTGRSTALNIDACRVGWSSGAEAAQVDRRCSPNARHDQNAAHGSGSVFGIGGAVNVSPAGRWPPNAVFSHAPGCRCVGERRVASGSTNAGRGVSGYGGALRAQNGNTDHADPDGTETVEAWECVDENCPVAELDRQNGETRTNGSKSPTRQTSGIFGGADRQSIPVDHGDTGTAARYFPQFPADEYALFGYHAKPSRAEKDAGLAAMPAVRLPHDVRSNMCATCGRKVKANGSGVRCECGDARVTTQIERAGNNHPTVKSIALMRWLVRLVTRPGDVVLDPFGGSGTTGVAALCEGRRVILVERDPRFAEIARQRCEHATPDLGVPVRVAAKPAPAADPRQQSLFGGDR